MIKGSSTVQANATEAPDGTSTADELVEGSGGGFHHVAQDLPSLSDDSPQAVSIFAKASGRDWLFIRTLSKAGSSGSTFFNLDTGVVGTVNFLHSGVRMVPYRDSWYRCELVFNSGSGGSTPDVRFALSNQGSNASYTGDGSSGVYLWGAQLEEDHATVSSYVETISSAVTREADKLSWAFPRKPLAMTFYVRFVEQGTRLEGGRLFHVGAGDSDSKSLVVDSDGTDYRIKHTNSTSVESTEGTASLGDVVELRSLLYSGGAVQNYATVNGGSESEGSESGALALADDWQAEKIHLGGRDGGEGGICGLLVAVVAYGKQDLDYMRKLSV